MHFLEILKSSVNYNIILIRPKHGSHDHLDEGEKKCICYHAVEKAQIMNKSREKPSALTLLFSLCITPITRTLMGYRWASMMKRHRQKSVLSNPVVRCNRSVSVSLWFGDEGEMLRRCICIHLRRCGCE